MRKKLPLILCILTITFLGIISIPVNLSEKVNVPCPFEQEGAGVQTYFFNSWIGWGSVRSLVAHEGLPLTYEGFQYVVEKYLLPLGIRGVYIGREIGAANYSDLHSWLKVSDDYGFMNWINLMNFGYIKDYPPELRGKNHPNAMSYNRSGAAQPEYAVPIDFHDIHLSYFKSILSNMITWYGQYKSIIGIGGLPKTDYPVYGHRVLLADYGFNNQTILNFTKTKYYFVDVNATGYHADGTNCRLWKHFKEGILYNTTMLTDDISKYHYARTDRLDISLRGWGAYLNVENAKLVKKLYDWLKAEKPDVDWIVISPFEIQVNLEAGMDDPNIIYSVQDYIWLQENYLRILSAPGEGKYVTGLVNILSHGDPPINWDEILRLYNNTFFVHAPLLTRGQVVLEVQWGVPFITNTTRRELYTPFGTLLNRMRYVGGTFGDEKGLVDLLVIGELSVAYNPFIWTRTFKTTLTGGPFEDLNLTRFSNFKQCDSFVIWSGGRPVPNALTTNAQQRILDRIFNGTGIVVLGAMPTWLSAVIGSGTPITLGHPITKPFTNVAGLPASYEYSYGNGRVIQLGMPAGRIEYIGSGSDYWVIATNAVLYTSKHESSIPAWHHGSTIYTSDRPWSGNIYFSILGSPNTQTLLWLSNNGSSTQNFEIHLNAPFFNIGPNGWIAINVQSWQVVAKSGGTDIKINTTIPAKSWKPIYIMNATSNLHDLYSNVFIKSKSITTNKATYTLSGPYNQTSWLIVNSTKTPTSVAANNTGALSQYASLAAINATTTQNGWYHDPTNNLLYIKFKTTSIVEIEVTQPTEPAPPTPAYTLSIYSSPASGVSFSVNGTSYVTPLLATFDKGNYTMIMPKLTILNGKTYNFKNWENGAINPIRTISLSGDTSATAYYEQATGPPTTHILSISSSPITEISFTIHGTEYTTPWSNALPEATYIITMSSNVTIGNTSYNFVRWEDLTNSLTRAINLITNTTMTAYYEAIPTPSEPPPPTDDTQNSTNSSTNAQFSVAIEVIDLFTKQPVKNASIQIRNETWISETKYTNETGWVHFSRLAPGTYTVVGNANEYATTEETISITTNTTYTLQLSKTLLSTLTVSVPEFESLLIAISPSVAAYLIVQGKFKKQETKHKSTP